MIILTIRTDKPEAEIGLYEDQMQLAYDTWLAHRELAETIHGRIAALLESKGKQLHDADGIVCFRGPGSFTGLRIGLTVANALAMGLGIPVVATRNDNWVNTGVQQILAGKNEHPVLPYYGAEAHITPQKK